MESNYIGLHIIKNILEDMLRGVITQIPRYELGFDVIRDRTSKPRNIVGILALMTLGILVSSFRYKKQKLKEKNSVI